MTRQHRYRDVYVTMTVNAMTGRRMRWRFETTTGLIDNGWTAFGVEAAFRDATSAAEVSIDGAMDG